VTIAGQRILQTFPPLPNQSTTVSWDGKDAYGRVVQGAVLYKASIGFEYPAVYTPTPPRSGYSETFGPYVIGGAPNANGVEVTVQTHERTREFIYFAEWSGTFFEQWDARALFGLGGWGLDAVHVHDDVQGILLYGDGRTVRSTAEMATLDVGARVPRLLEPSLQPSVGAGEAVYAAHDYLDSATWTESESIFRIALDGTTATSPLADRGLSCCPSIRAAATSSRPGPARRI
jgi:hypothetical protein